MDRKYFTDKLDNSINAFLPIDVKEVNIDFKYVILLIGVLYNGEKACLFISDIKPFFDLELPLENTKEFLRYIEELDSGALTKFNSEIIIKTKFKYYTPNKYQYKRFYFDNLFKRTEWLNYFMNNDYCIIYNADCIKFCNSDDIEDDSIPKINYILASNDKTSYYRKFARENKIKLNDWILCDSDTCYPSEHHKLHIKNIKNIYSMNYKNVKNIPVSDYDVPVLELSWDIETYSNGDGVPSPNNPNDVIFMLSCSINWINKDEPCLNYLLSTLCFPNEFVTKFPHIILKHCNDERELVIMFLKIINNFQPDIIIGFNDFLYDWPFIINKIEQYKLQNIVKQVSIFTNKYLLERYKRNEIIKIEANRDSSALFLDIPGSICLDVRVNCMKEMPTAEYTSLKFFLKLYSLQPKVELSIHTMRKLYKAIHTFNKWDYELLKDYYEDYSMLIEYSMVDSLSCHSLATKRNMFANIKENANIAYVSFYDSFFRAGGMRVRNLIMAEGCNEFSFDLSTPEKRNLNKYPGAYVITPETRLHKYYGDSPVIMTDFSSLYPNITISYNLSQECVFLDKELLNHYDKNKYYHHEIEFLYGKDIVKGWVLRYKDKNDMGLCPRILVKLYNDRIRVREEIKQQLENLKKSFGNVESNNVSGPLYMGSGTYTSPELLENATPQLREQNAAVLSNAVNSIANVDKQLEQTKIKIKNLDAIQYAIKIYMNTFYGESGNSISPFYIPLVAGGITTIGQFLLKFCIEFLKDNGNDIVYGDTDSVYYKKKFSLYNTCDAEPHISNICNTAPQVWINMINKSIDYANEDKILLNNALKKLTSQEFLKLEFEGVLFPAFMIEKKNYIGIKYASYTDNIQASQCTTIEEFKNQKSLLIKGLEIKKRGIDLYTKHCVFNILKEMFSVNNMNSLEQIIQTTYSEIYSNNEIDISMYVKTAQYRDSAHNTFIKTFIERLACKSNNLASNVVPASTLPQAACVAPAVAPQVLPEVNERFNYIVVINNDERFNKNIKISDKMELYEEGKSYNIDREYYNKSLRSIIIKFIKNLSIYKDKTHSKLEKEIMSWCQYNNAVYNIKNHKYNFTINNIITVTNEEELYTVMIQYAKLKAKKYINDKKKCISKNPEKDYKKYLNDNYEIVIGIINNIKTDLDVNMNNSNTILTNILIQNMYYTDLVYYYKNIENVKYNKIKINIVEKEKLFPTKI